MHTHDSARPGHAYHELVISDWEYLQVQLWVFMSTKSLQFDALLLDTWKPL